MSIPLLGVGEGGGLPDIPSWLDKDELEHGVRDQLLVCADCATIEHIPYFAGPVEHNQPYQARLRNHLVPTAEGVSTHSIAFTTVNAKLWASSEEFRTYLTKAIGDAAKTGDVGLGKDMYALRESYQDQAMRCWRVAHNRTQDCDDYKSDKMRLDAVNQVDGVRGMRKDLGMSVKAKDQPAGAWLCQWCLTGDTEVVTRQGIVPIGSLSGTTADLLVPSRSRHGGLVSRGTFVSAPVRSFGEHDVFEITLTRGRSRKTVRATAEHRWITDKFQETTTADLGSGTRLATLQATSLREGSRGIKEVPFATAQGFIYGDGSCGHSDERPATLPVYNIEKDKAMFKYFAGHEVVDHEFPQLHGGTAVVFQHLPRSWKRVPTMDDSRAFLLSWLSGYFAADGTVSSTGQATISTASWEAAQFVRSVAAVCGVGYGPIQKKLREGFPGREPSALYSVNLRASDLPEWFWHIDMHRDRVLAHNYVDRYLSWTVESVTPAGREEVFCATVDGVGAFGLADMLMTGNCPFHRIAEDKARKKQGYY
jgi:hypothetical protein